MHRYAKQKQSGEIGARDFLSRKWERGMIVESKTSRSSMLDSVPRRKHMGSNLEFKWHHVNFRPLFNSIIPKHIIAFSIRTHELTDHPFVFFSFPPPEIVQGHEWTGTFLRISWGRDLIKLNSKERSSMMRRLCGPFINCRRSLIF